MADCEFIEKCLIFQKSKTGVIVDTFTGKYCRGPRLENCERRKLKKSGDTVPDDLLPNGARADL